MTNEVFYFSVSHWSNTSVHLIMSTCQVVPILLSEFPSLKPRVRNFSQYKGVLYSALLGNEPETFGKVSNANRHMIHTFL